MYKLIIIKKYSGFDQSKRGAAMLRFFAVEIIAASQILLGINPRNFIFKVFFIYINRHVSLINFNSQQRVLLHYVYYKSEHYNTKLIS